MGELLHFNTNQSVKHERPTANAANPKSPMVELQVTKLAIKG
jgi:hypothetical protein